MNRSLAVSPSRTMDRNSSRSHLAGSSSRSSKYSAYRPASMVLDRSTSCAASSSGVLEISCRYTPTRSRSSATSSVRNTVTFPSFTLGPLPACRRSRSEERSCGLPPAQQDPATGDSALMRCSHHLLVTTGKSAGTYLDVPTPHQVRRSAWRFAERYPAKRWVTRCQQRKTLGRSDGSHANWEVMRRNCHPKHGLRANDPAGPTSDVSQPT